MDSKPTYEDLKDRINDLESKLENNPSKLEMPDYIQEETPYQRENEFKTLVDNAPDIIFRFDHLFRHTYVNAAVEKATGIPKETFLGKDHRELGMPEDVVLFFQKHIRKVFESGQEIEFSFTFPSPTGEQHYESRYVPEFSKNGIVEHVMGITRNVTEHKQAVKALEESEARFKRMFEIHNAVMLLIEPKTGLIIKANNAAIKFYGYSKSELCSMTINDLNMSSPEQVLIARNNALNENRNHFDFPHKLENGDIRTVEVHSTPIEYNQQRILFSIIHDITERKQVEDDLLENQYRNEKSQALGHVGNWDYNLESKLLWVSDETKRIYGFNLDSNNFSVEQIENCIPERERVHQALIDLIDHDKKYDLEFEIRPADKTPRKIIHSIAELERDAFNKPLRVRGVVLDITERKHAEKELKESEEKFRGIYEQSPIAIEIYDKEGKLIDVNKKTLELFGIDDVKYVLGFDLFDDPNLSKDRILKLKRGEPVFISTDFDFDIIKSHNLYPTSRNGIMYMDMHAIPLLSNKETIGYLVQIIETSEQKQAELALKESEARFKQLIKNSFDMIILMDSEGVQQFISESCEKILGYKPEELVGISVIEQMVHPEDQESTKKDFLDIIENNAKGGTQYRHLHKNGNWVYLEAFGNNQLDNPEIKSVVLNVRDITERKHAVQIIKENETHLKEINATKNKLFSIIAHDLRSPFTGILGYSELLINNIKDFELTESEKYLEIINSSAKNTLTLLDNLLNWARSQTGQISFNPKKINLSSIIRGTIELSNMLAMGKGISISQNNADDIEVYADKDMLKIVLRNLISNAIKFTKPGGNISIFTKKEQSQVEISIVDNGVGMNDETINKLFRIETNNTTIGTENEKGSGLGLILCKELVEKQGGKIWVESEFGKGSVFKFILPLNKSSE